MGTKRINPGILSLNGEPFKGDWPLTVVIHPYYPDDHYHVDEEEQYKALVNGDYFNKLNHFIASHPGSILTLEERKYFRRTMKRYAATGMKRNRLFARTKSENSIPADISDAELFKFIEEHRGEFPIGLAGGYLHFMEESWSPIRWGGCLGDFAEALSVKEIPFKFLEGLVFH